MKKKTIKKGESRARVLSSSPELESRARVLARVLALTLLYLNILPDLTNCAFDASLFLIVCARDPFVSCALVPFQNLMFTFRCSQARKRAIPLYENCESSFALSTILNNSA